MPREIYKVTAQETTDLTGGHSKLTVTADLQTFSGNEQLSLFEAVPQGPNADILILEVKGDPVGTGIQVLGCKTVTFIRPISAHQFGQVTVTTDGFSSTVNVQRILS